MSSDSKWLKGLGTQGMPVILALGRQKQENRKFKTILLYHKGKFSLGYRSSCAKTPKMYTLCTTSSPQNLIKCNLVLAFYYFLLQIYFT